MVFKLLICTLFHFRSDTLYEYEIFKLSKGLVPEEIFSRDPIK